VTLIAGWVHYWSGYKASVNCTMIGYGRLQRHKLLANLSLTLKSSTSYTFFIEVQSMVIWLIERPYRWHWQMTLTDDSKQRDWQQSTCHWQLTSFHPNLNLQNITLQYILDSSLYRFVKYINRTSAAHDWFKTLSLIPTRKHFHRRHFMISGEMFHYYNCNCNK